MTDRPGPIPAGRTGFYLAVAAIAVNAPRLVLAFLEVDGLAVAPAWRVALLGLTGVVTGVVLTGGGAYLAHALSVGASEAGGGNRRSRRLLAATWLLVLTCSTALVAPMLVAGFGREPLPRVLPSSGLRWTWSAVAVLAVELVAAGSMVAQGADERGKLRAHEAELELLEVARERNELRARLEELLPRPEAPAAGEARAGKVGPAREGGRRGRAELRRELPEVARAERGRAREVAEVGEVPEADEVRQVPEPELPPRSVPCRNGCGWVGSSPRAECGHQRGCPARRSQSGAAVSSASGSLP